MNVVLKKATSHCLRNVFRFFTKTATLGAYSGEGKTTLHIMNKEEDLGLLINGYSQVGFKLNNNITILGPMIIFPRSVLSWDISNINDVTEESLSLFKILEPKLDIIVIGTGDQIDNFNFFTGLREFSVKNKIAFEILPTVTACPTFNFLNAEGRNVVGAMIPPQNISYTEEDQFGTKLRYQNVLVKQ